MDTVSQDTLDALYAWCGKDDAKIEVTSPQTWVYNCIAFAMGSEEMWVAAGHPKGWYSWWPDTVTRDDNPLSLMKAFEYVGFEQCFDAQPEKGYDKVVLYKKKKLNGTYGWTHAAKVVGVHELHSKLGALYDMHHRDGDVFEDCGYGEEYAYMKRLISERHVTKDKLPNQCVVIIGGIRHMLTFDGVKLIADVIVSA